MTANAQLILNLPTIAARGREDFFVSSSNRRAVEMIDNWRDWPGRRLILCGPARSGKTHLASIWAERQGARIVEAARLALSNIGADIRAETQWHAGAGTDMRADAALVVENADRLAALAPGDRERAEKALFHLHNRMGGGAGTEAGTGAGTGPCAGPVALLITGTGFPASWPVALPDLRSRLAAATVAEIDAPDDALLSSVLIKLFADRQLLVEPRVIDYMLDRMERSCAAAETLIDRIDAASLRNRRRVTTALVREHAGWKD